MPRLPSIRVSALADMAEQLRFVPSATARRHVERAEAFLLALDPSKMYDEVAIARSITAYAPEIESPAMIVGEALLADLGALIERLSVRAEYRREELADWPGPDELCARWKVSRRTLERYRLAGLAGRRARNPGAPEGNGKEVLRFSPRIVAWFENRNSARLEQGRVFSRIDEETQARIIRRARVYRRRLGCSRGQAASRLGPRFGRSPDTVRRLLIRHDQLHAGEAPPIFPEPGPVSDRRTRVIERALRWRGVGIAPSEIAKRVRKTSATVQRIVLEERARMLRELEVQAPESPVYREPRAGERILAAPAARAGLGLPSPPTVRAFLDLSSASGWPDRRIERERAEAWCFLRWRASKNIAALPRSPGAEEIDACWTDLLWAARLKAELVRAEGLLLRKTAEVQVGAALEAMPEAEAAAVYRAAIQALVAPGDGVDRYDPFKGGRVAAPAGVAINRAISRWLGAHPRGADGVRAGSAAPPDPRRAVRLVPEAAPVLEDWTRSVHPSQAWIEPHPLVFTRLEQADAETRRLLSSRFGWLEGPPRAIRDLAQEAGCRPTDMARRLRYAMLQLISAKPTDAASKTGKDSP